MLHCSTCGQNLHDISEYSYMLQSWVWKQLPRPGKQNGYCIGCVEWHLDRRLFAFDFNWRVPLTWNHRERNSKRLLNRKHNCPTDMRILASTQRYHLRIKHNHRIFAFTDHALLRISQHKIRNLSQRIRRLGQKKIEKGFTGKIGRTIINRRGEFLVIVTLY